MNIKKMNSILAFLMSIMISVLIGSSYTVTAYAEEGSGGQTPSGIPYSRLEQELDSFVNAHIGQSSPGAAIVVTKGGKMIFSKGYGYADLEQHLPADPARTVFDYGSVNKLFVWTAAMQLAEAGKIGLDKDIRMYLPESFVQKLRYTKPITMLDIMSHTAGFEQYPLPLFIQSEERLQSLEETLLSSQPEQIYEPGQVMAYSNYAAALAGYVVEQVSGEPFSEYERQKILRPLGMEHASGHPALNDHPDLLEESAVGYGVQGNGKFEPRGRYYVPFYPAGAMKGTAEDLARFAIALTSPGSPLFRQDQTLHTMLSQSYTPHAEILSNAHGFWEYRTQPRAVGHSGNTMGFSSEFVIVPEEQLGVVILTNAEVEQEITTGVIDLLIRGKGKAEGAIRTPTGPSLSAAQLPMSEEAAGHYVLAQNSFTTFHEFMSYLGLISLKAKGEHDLTLSVMGMTGDYKQTSPYVYQLEQGSNSRLQRIAPALYVEMSEGTVRRISRGKAADIIPLTPGRSFPALIAFAVVAVIVILFFLLTPLVVLVNWLLRRRKGERGSVPGTRLFTAVIICGMLLVLNVLFQIANVLGNDAVTVAQLNLGIIINWILALLADLLLILAIRASRYKPQSKGRKAFRATTAVLLISFLFLLYNWHFFHLIP